MTQVNDNPIIGADPGRQVEERLRGLWSRRAGRTALRGGAWLVAAATALLLLDLVLDWRLDLPGSARALLAAANLAVLAVVAHQQLIRHLARYDALDMALAVERLRPELDGVVISCVQFSPQGRAQPGVSRSLMQAVRRLAAGRVAGVDLAPAARVEQVRRALGAAVLGLLLVLGVGLWHPRLLSVLASRMVNPFSGAVYPTDTLITGASGDLVVRQSEPVALYALAGGEVPREGRLWLRVGAAAWEGLDLKLGPGDRFEYVLPRATEEVQYYFRLGDARSPRYRVTVVRPPRIVAARVGLEYPAYTRLASQEVDTFNLKVPEGTRLTWRLTFDRPIGGAGLHLEGAEPRPMQLAAEGREASLSLTAEASRSYSVNLHWTMDRRQFTETPARHYIQVIPDADPQVALLEPSEDAKASLRKTVPIKYWARDDYGLAEAGIIYSVNDGGELRFPLPPFQGKTADERALEWPITQVIPGLKRNDIVTFALQVSDGRPDRPGLGRSPARRVQFVSDGEYVAYVLARQRKLLGQIRPLYLQEREATAHLESLRQSAPDAGAPMTRPVSTIGEGKAP